MTSSHCFYLDKSKEITSFPSRNFSRELEKYMLTVNIVRKLDIQFKTSHFSWGNSNIRIGSVWNSDFRSECVSKTKAQTKSLWRFWISISILKWARSHTVDGCNYLESESFWSIIQIYTVLWNMVILPSKTCVSTPLYCNN